MTVWLLELLRECPDRKKAVALALVLALSGELHGGFVFLFVAVAIELAAELWDLSRAAQGAQRGFAAATGFALAAGLASFALHPHGVQALWHPMRYALDPRLRDVFENTTELLPPNFTTSAGVAVGAFVLVLFFAMLTTRARSRTSDVLLVVAFLHLALHSARGVHYLTIVAAGPIAAGLDEALERARAGARSGARAVVEALDALEPAARRAARRVPGALALALGLSALSWRHELRPVPEGDMSSPRLVGLADIAAVASFIAATDPPGQVWNDFQSGGVLIWKLFPRRRVFIDGRGDFHALAGTFRESEEVFHAAQGWESILRRRDCDLVLTSRNGYLAHELRAAGWRVVYRWVTSSSSCARTRRPRERSRDSP